MATYDDLMKEYRRLAKRADQRLVRIERASGKRGSIKGESAKKGMENLISYAYKKAMMDIRQWSGPGASRFNTAPPTGKDTRANIMKLRAKIQDIKDFLEKPTSTVSGTEKIYQRRAEGLSESWGIDMTWQEIKQVTDSALFEKLESKMDRYIVLKVLGVIQDNKDNVEKRLKGIKDQGQTIHIQVDDPVIKHEVEKVLTYYKKDLKKLIKSDLDMKLIK